MIQGRLATLAELDSVYGTEDLHDMLELLLIEAVNRKIIEKDAEKG